MNAEPLAVDGGELLHLANVGPGHEGAARAGEDDHIDFRVVFRLVHGGVQVGEDLRVEGVEGLLPVNGHDAHMPPLFQRYKCHVICLLVFGWKPCRKAESASLLFF